MSNTGILHKKVICAHDEGSYIISEDIAKQDLKFNVASTISDGRIYIVLFGKSYDYSGDAILDALCLLASPKQANIDDCVIENAFITDDNIWTMYEVCDMTITMDNDTALYHTTRQFARQSDLFNNTKVSYWKRIA